MTLACFAFSFSVPAQFNLKCPGRSDASKAACNAWAGATGELSTLAHGVSGSVTIQGDCSVLISPFSYDGQGPGAYWVVEAGGDEKTISAKSQQLNQPAKVSHYSFIIILSFCC